MTSVQSFEPHFREELLGEWQVLAVDIPDQLYKRSIIDEGEKGLRTGYFCL
jgi:hypothetical protein